MTIDLFIEIDRHGLREGFTGRNRPAKCAPPVYGQRWLNFESYLPVNRAITREEMHKKSRSIRRTTGIVSAVGKFSRASSAGGRLRLQKSVE